MVVKQTKGETMDTKNVVAEKIETVKNSKTAKKVAKIGGIVAGSIIVIGAGYLIYKGHLDKVIEVADEIKDSAAEVVPEVVEAVA